MRWHRQQRHRPAPRAKAPRPAGPPKPERRRWSEPTRRQVHLLAFIAAFKNDGRDAPTYEEMAAEARVTKQAIGKQLAVLERKGWLKRGGRGSRRALTLTTTPSAEVAHGG